ncbi:hypothetical protein A2631_05225 [Candidatus Daviesbacteria bacterium RIFCSPHIGHO2_01_FULL_44_29]|uniref:N-acetylmuramoyl-L-alanine amidase n=1 Tax=Candidatus Daviesbacteria bacterium RIFCSPHIGHO2_02_FULL_43_12 TaxID=1797776 RepID=A0A1F5KHN7_9BACT|nr:MAG: hypothetical protein A2631_05225 [Candidatus Daviesbacteria bacterium RIFCSPHIGHO2_01_FULL_44_29]OGE40121.1 MAG: hypothetical protein A3D25_04945 [Candidatus Daviesbacteria bacterium RIFCSPHIGHO2_02_FULL_43_12]OGE41070.1 MAG: hypothetical protein A3E86_05050 [Candidatus Daviesbacteria bacterium RIFCSPHIGHO2_12_FULL_47_45]OGE70198.1 MAG: hypothetical protein A3B55_00615 [Candidatus Daviesbacteria bacterium RIFCSPLOWO2_01_FULL_43_15]
MKIIFLIGLTLTLIFAVSIVKAVSKEVYTPPVYTTVGDYQEPTTGTGACAGRTVSFGVEKKFVPLPSAPMLGSSQACAVTETEACGRPGDCTTPKRIVLHTTAGILTAQETYEYFAKGSPSTGGYRGVAAHFVVGKDGQVIQMVETYTDKVERAYAVANYGDHISIEMGHQNIYRSKGEVPTVQYQATLQLVRQLMKQYNIPVGSLEYTWKSDTEEPNPAAIPGIYGHYQLNPFNRTDPGDGLMRDLRQDLK